MKMRRIAVTLALALATPVATTACAADMTPTAATAQSQAQPGYLGIYLGPVSGALRSQLDNVLPAGQGVLIRGVVPDSPAAKAGLRDYDILVTYGDQRLYSTEQLSRLVRADQPDTTVTLGVVRDGAIQDLRVTLGKAEATPEVGYSDTLAPKRFDHSAMPYGQGTTDWTSFDSLSLKKLKDGKFRAEVRFLGKDHKLVKRDFTGTRKAIHDEILAQKELPRGERGQLLAVLGARDMPFYMPPGFWSGAGPYAPSWFQAHPWF